MQIMVYMVKNLVQHGQNQTHITCGICYGRIY